jgi:hypothetical protein
MEDKSAVLADVCAALADGQDVGAAGILNERYPFVSLVNSGRNISLPARQRVFKRDGFIDRYSGARLVFPGTLLLVSKRLPEQFPYQTNWRMDSCHIGFWELFPTVDHVMPVSRGGADSEDNLVTTSQIRNSAKANFTLNELGWSLCDPGRPEEWDGLTEWFVAQVRRNPAILSDNYLKRWHAAATQTRALPL